MMVRFLLILMFFVFCFSASASGWRPTAWYDDFPRMDGGDPECEERRIAFVGDSLLRGRWFTDYFHDQFLWDGWYEWDTEHVTEADFVVENFSERGAGVSRIAENLLVAFHELGPTHVVIYAGINDCTDRWNPPNVNAIHVVEAIERMIVSVQRHGAIPIIVQHHPWNQSHYDRKGKGWECSRLVNEWINGEQLIDNGAQVVRTMGFGSCDGMDGARMECKCSDETCETRFVMDPELSRDGLHFNRVGQAVFADMIQEQVVW